MTRHSKEQKIKVKYEIAKSGPTITKKNCKKIGRRNYTEVDLITAVDLYKEGNLSMRKISRMTGVPKTTLLDYSKQKLIKLRKPGSKPVLTPEEEEMLVLWMQSCSKRGFPRQDEMLIKEAECIVNAKSNSKRLKLRNGKPGILLVQ